MPPPPASSLPASLRRLLLSAFTSITFFAWFVSGSFWAQLPIRRGQSLYCIDVSIGCIWLVKYTGVNSTPSRREHTRWDIIADVGETGWRLLPEFQLDRPGTPLSTYGNLTFHWHLALPLYPAFLLTAVPTALSWRTFFRQRRHARQGHCPTCGYDLRGVQGPCPECSKPVPPTRPVLRASGCDSTQRS